MNDVLSHFPPVQTGEVMRACSLREVIESKHPEFTVRDMVTGLEKNP